MNRSRSTSLRLRPAALALALTAGIGLAQAQVFSQPDTDFKGSVRVSTPLVLPGSEIELSGSGFKPGQKVTLSRGGTVLNAQPYIADGEGKFSAKLTIPADAVAGTHPVVVRSEGPDAASVLELKVSKKLPLTGQEHFDVASNPLAPGLYQAAYSNRNNSAFVTRAVGRPPVKQSELLKVDPKTLEIVARATPPAAPAPEPRPGQEPGEGGLYAVYGVAVDDANGNVWVTNTRQNTVAVYRQSDLSLVKQFPVGAVPHSRDVVVDPARNRAYVSAVEEPVVAVFDTRTLQQLDGIRIESTQSGEKFAPTSLDLDAATGKLYTVSIGTSEAAVIDAAAGKVDKVFPLTNARSAVGVAWDPDHKRLLVTAQGSDNLLILDPQTGKTVHDVYVGAGALNVAYDPASKLAYVSNRAAGTVAVVDAQGQVVANLEGGTFPNHVTKGPKGTVLAVNKSRGEDDPNGDRITRIAPKAH